MNGSRVALDTRIATVALALVLAMVGMPIMSGWVLADARCAITMDICHPAQSIDVTHTPLLAAGPKPFSMNKASRDAVRSIDYGYRAMSGRLAEAPDLPPPKALA